MSCIQYAAQVIISRVGHVFFSKERNGLVFFSKERNVLMFFCVLYKKNAAFFIKRTLPSLRSFTFFIKECCILCVLFVLYKRTQHSLRSFMFFIKERKRMLHSFWFYKSYKNDKSRRKKERKRMVHSFFKVKKELNVLFCNIFI